MVAEIEGALSHWPAAEQTQLRRHLRRRLDWGRRTIAKRTLALRRDALQAEYSMIVAACNFANRAGPNHTHLAFQCDAMETDVFKELDDAERQIRALDDGDDQFLNPAAGEGETA